MVIPASSPYATAPVTPRSLSPTASVIPPELVLGQRDRPGAGAAGGPPDNFSMQHYDGRRPRGRDLEQRNIY